MNAHSQADDPALVHVMQFNADERDSQEKLLQKLASLEELLREEPVAAGSGVPQIVIGTGIVRRPSG